MGAACCRRRPGEGCGQPGCDWSDDTLGAPMPRAPRVDSQGRRLLLSPSRRCRAAHRTPSVDLPELGM